MQYTEYKPHPLLRPYVECYWSALADAPPFQEQEALIPDGTIELMFNFGDDYRQAVGDELKPVKGSHVIGIRRRSLFIAQSTRQNFFSVRFKTGGSYPIFGIPGRHFADRIESISALLGREYTELEERLFHCRDNHSRTAVLDSFLLRKLDRTRPALQTARNFMKAADAIPGASVAEVAAAMGSGYKTLERAFADASGLSPRRYLSIRRFNRAVKLMYAPGMNSLTAVSLAAGYYDQAHFIRDFKALTFQTPRDFLKSQFTIVQVIQPALAERLSKTYNL